MRKKWMQKSIQNIISTTSIKMCGTNTMVAQCANENILLDK